MSRIEIVQFPYFSDNYGVLIHDRNTKKTVALENLFKFPLGSLTTNIQLDQNNIDITDNSEDEISQSTVEMLNSLDGKINNQRFTIVNDDFKKKLDILNNDKYEFPLKAMANMSTSFFNKN